MEATTRVAAADVAMYVRLRPLRTKEVPVVHIAVPPVELRRRRELLTSCHWNCFCTTNMFLQGALYRSTTRENTRKVNAPDARTILVRVEIPFREWLAEAGTDPRVPLAWRSAVA